jgi:hypothetical protein
MLRYENNQFNNEGTIIKPEDVALAFNILCKKTKNALSQVNETNDKLRNLVNLVEKTLRVLRDKPDPSFVDSVLDKIKTIQK